MAFQASSYKHALEIIAVNRIKSRDILLQVTLIEAREVLEREQSWVNTIYYSAVVVRKSFGVVVHGVRVSIFNTKNQQAIKEKIQRENRALHPNLDIVEGRWLTGTYIPEKAYSSFIVSVALLIIADDLIRKGLVEVGEMKLVEWYK